MMSLWTFLVVILLFLERSGGSVLCSKMVGLMIYVVDFNRNCCFDDDVVDDDVVKML